MDEREAARLAESWPGARGLVPRGPRWLLGWGPADPADVERHTGRRPASEVWRVEIGGRFLRAGGLVYPGGVPFPEDLAGMTAVVTSEVWLYVDASGRLVGLHWWPEAVRRPVASVPREDWPRGTVRTPEQAARELDFPLPLPSHPSWDPALVVVVSAREAVVLCVRELVPDPLNEMLLFAEGGLSLRASPDAALDPEAILRRQQPPFRSCAGGGVGREQGRPLGPQTWPWPAELWWRQDGVTCALKGFVPLGVLEEVARSVGV